MQYLLTHRLGEVDGRVHPGHSERVHYHVGADQRKVEHVSLSFLCLASWVQGCPSARDNREDRKPL